MTLKKGGWFASRSNAARSVPARVQRLPDVVLVDEGRDVDRLVDPLSMVRIFARLRPV